MKQLKDLAGKHILTGVEFCETIREKWGHGESVNGVKFTLDGITYLVAEDPSDGYRSYAEDLEVVDEPCKTPLPNVEVVCTMREDRYQEDDVLVFIDALNGKKILEVGTANTNDYYPYCVMEYAPENMSCNENRRIDNGA